jgi:hypothetical protein
MKVAGTQKLQCCAKLHTALTEVSVQLHTAVRHPGGLPALDGTLTLLDSRRGKKRWRLPYASNALCTSMGEGWGICETHNDLTNVREYQPEQIVFELRGR